MRRARAGGLAALVLGILALTACASSPPAPGSAPSPSLALPDAPTATPSPVGDPTAISGPRPYYDTPATGEFAALPGWVEEDHAAALAAYAAGCGPARDAAARDVCAQARTLAGRAPTGVEARGFFENRFTVQSVGGEGLLTSYFAPEYEARRERTWEFDAPVLGVPSDLVRRPGTGGRATYRRLTGDGDLVDYPDRAAIERAAEEGRSPGAVLAWMRAEDLFFMQIQGSGYLRFEDGGHARAAYAADNGRPFVGIARPMAERGLLPRDGTSGEAIAGWLRDHRGAEAKAVMALNPRYIFFDLQPDDGGHPAGAAGVPLPAGRAIAVDPAHWRYGEAVWIDAGAGNLAGARRGYRGLVMALDTGSAIRGQVRADYYMGRGAEAGAEAGTVRHPLQMWRLVPRP